jgi:T5SS/PEP-CTERM-associated repeat protein
MDQGNGTVTLNDATLNVSKSLVVGLEGTGTLSVTNGGVVTATEVQVGVRSGSAGDIALSNGGTLNASSSLSIGSGPTALDGSGTGTVSVGASSLITVGSIVLVHANQTLALSGGMVAMGPNAEYLNIDAGGTLSGYGTVSAQSGQGIYDHGTISAIGGTLVLNGSVHDNGVLAIGNASTAFVNGTLLGPVAVEFTGAAGTLELATGITSYAQIHDFAVGDQIVMAGVNGIGWDAALGVLELKNSGHAVDRLHFVGSYAADHFTISQSSAGAVIGLATGH